MAKGQSFDWVVNGRLLRVFQQWRSCGHKQTKDAQNVRCKRCYPGSGKVYHSHGPYYFGYYRDATGKRHRVYIGRELPPMDEVKEA